MKKLFCLFLVILLLFCSCSLKDTHPYYNMISNFEAGSKYDILAKEYAKALEKEFKKPVNVINAKTDSQFAFSDDGYTIFFDNLSNIKYFTLSAIAEDPFVVVVKSDTIYDNIEKLLTVISRNPNKIEIAFKSADENAKKELSILEKCGYHPFLIPLNTTEDSIDAVVNEQAIFSIVRYSEAREKIESGTILLACVFSSQRLAKYPQIPAISEIITESDEYIKTPLEPFCIYVNDKVPNYMKEFLISASNNSTKDLAFNQYLEENGYIKLF